MIFDGALAEPEIRRDVLARVAGEDQVHDPALLRGEGGDELRRILAPAEQRAQSPLLPLDQLVHLTTESCFPPESLSQPDFRA